MLASNHFLVNITIQLHPLCFTSRFNTRCVDISETTWHIVVICTSQAVSELRRWKMSRTFCVEYDDVTVHSTCVIMCCVRSQGPRPLTLKLPNSNQLMLESQWTFVPNLKTFTWCVLAILCSHRPRWLSAGHGWMLTLPDVWRKVYQICPSRFSLFIVSSVANQSGGGEMRNIYQIPYIYRSRYLKHSNEASELHTWSVKITAMRRLHLSSGLISQIPSLNKAMRTLRHEDCGVHIV